MHKGYWHISQTSFPTQRENRIEGINLLSQGTLVLSEENQDNTDRPERERYQSCSNGGI